MTKKILIIGGTGDIGKAISKKFLTKDKSIVKPLPKPKVKLQTKKKEAKKKDNIKSSFQLKLENA